MGSRNKNQTLVFLLIIILPFLLFFRIMPFVSDWTLGNDYPRFSIWNQLELMFCVKTGSFPLYIPGFAGGHSASALTLGQLYHPLSFVAALMPGYWQGYALEWNTFLRLLTLGLAHMILYVFLKRLNIQTAFALVLSTITVYNLRMLDLFRYGASLESWTGFLVLCSAIGSYYLEPKRKLFLVTIVAATYWLICSGHPQMSYYGLFGAGIFALLIPSVVAHLIAVGNFANITRTRFYLTVFICIAIGGLLSSAYIFPFYFDFIKLNATRITQEYSWADGYRDTLSGTINNFFFPLRSDVHGAFGGSLLYLVAALLPIIAFFRIKVPRIMWVIWMILACVFLFMQGVRTPVHYIAWKYLPFASSFRVAGRISMINPMLILLMLLWVVKTRDRINISIFQNKIMLNPGAFLAYVALIALGIFAFTSQFFSSSLSVYSAVSIREIPRYIEYKLLFSAILALLLFAVQGRLNRTKFLTEILFCLFSFFTLVGYLTYGTWIEEKRKTPTFQHMLNEKRENIGYRMPPGDGLISKIVQRQIEESCLEPYLGKIYCRFSSVEDNDSAYRYLAKGRAVDEIIIESNFIGQPQPDATDVSIYQNEIDLIYASFNKLVFGIHSKCSGFFGLAYPFTGHWRAKVDGNRVPVIRANGAANAIRIPAGKHQVEFIFWSNAAFWGMLISILTFVVAGCAFVANLMHKKMAVLLSFLILTIGTGLGWTWYHSLYHGDNLNTKYHWNSNSLHAPTTPSLAYGKRASFLSQGEGRWSLFSYGGLAVDGNYSSKSGFTSGFKMNPYWIVDLYDVHSIGSISLYEGYDGEEWNRRPLTILVSKDGKAWHQAAAIEKKISGQPIKKEFDNPEFARYLMIKAAGPSRLSFDEIEIFARE